MGQIISLPTTPALSDPNNQTVRGPLLSFVGYLFAFPPFLCTLAKPLCPKSHYEIESHFY